MSDTAIRVLIADDQRVVRDGLHDAARPARRRRGGRGRGRRAEAVELVERGQPDVVLMDLRMPHLDGVEATARLRDERPTTRVLVLTTYADDDVAVPRAAGRRARLPDQGRRRRGDRDAPSAPCTAARPHLDPAVQDALVAAATRSRRSRERESARRADRARGRGAHADRAGPVQRRDRRTAVRSATPPSRPTSTAIFAKTGARDRAQAVRYAYQHGLA